MNIKFLYTLLKNLSSKTFDKGEIVINEGDKINNVFYIRKGLVRSYLIDDKGEEISTKLPEQHRRFRAMISANAEKFGIKNHEKSSDFRRRHRGYNNGKQDEERTAPRGVEHHHC